jgi:hypothetical protein
MPMAFSNEVDARLRAPSASRSREAAAVLARWIRKCTAFGLPTALALLVFLGAPLGTAGSARAADMTFSLVPMGNPTKCRASCVDVIAADGEIVLSTPDTFLAFVKSHLSDPNLRSVVLMNSPGGRVVAWTFATSAQR